jgi:hypothetical protein
MVFDRRAANGAEFRTSGLLFKNNLVMYDRSPSGEVESLWPQMLTGGRCGPGEGRELEMVPSLEIKWEDWVALPFGHARRERGPRILKNLHKVSVWDLLGRVQLPHTVPPGRLRSS